MNKDKTKLIWIGLKRLVPWGETQFSLLGLGFSTSLGKIPSLNYLKAKTKMKLELDK